MNEGQLRRLERQLERVDAAVTWALKEGMRMHGLRQCDVAAAVGMTANTFSRSINRHRAFTLDEVSTICDYLGLDPFDVMFGRSSSSTEGGV